MSTVKYSGVRVMLLALLAAALGTFLYGGGSALADDGTGADPDGEDALTAGAPVTQGVETDPDGTGEETGAAYAKFDSLTGTLTFFRSDEVYETGQTETVADDAGEHTITYFADIETTDYSGSTSNFPKWLNEYRSLTRVVFEDEVAPISTSGWFYGLFYLESIEGLEKLDTSNVTNMWYMFGHCRGLSELDVSHMDVSRVTRFDSMFQECRGLTELDVSRFDTSQAESMSSMFYGCTGLTQLDVSGFDTSHVKDMAFMFASCISLTALDLSHFNTSRVERMRAMFSYCQALCSLDLSRLDTSSVTDMQAMFRLCSSLAELNTSGWDTSSVTAMDYMFYSCSKLTSLDLSELDTSNVESMKHMLSGCYRLAALDISNLDTSRVTDMSSMFYNCAALTSLDLSDLNVSKVTNFSEMFANCHGMVELDISELDTSSAQTMGGMFQNCEKLVSVNLSGLDISNVTNLSFMFSGCSNLSNLDLSDLDTASATNVRYMFSGCEGLTSLDASELNVARVTSMEHLFDGCSSLAALDMTGWDTSNVTTMECMFQGCASLSTLDMPGFNTSKVTSMMGMFNGCENLASLDPSRFDTSGVTNMGYMFYGCQVTALDLSGFDTSKVANMARMFRSCDKLAELDISGFDTSKVEDMGGMLYGCSSLEAIKLGAKTLLTNNSELPVREWQLASLGEPPVRYDALAGYDGANPGWYLKGYRDLAIEGLVDAVYTGEAIEQSLTVSVGDQALGEDADYTVSYAGNVNAGTATVTIAGAGRWVGSTTRTFEIAPKPIQPTLILSQAVFTYNGGPQVPDVTVKNGEDELVADEDYEVAFPDGCQEVGTYPVNVTLKGNYSGSASSTFEIVTNETVPALALSQAAFTYNGSVQVPEVEVRDADGALIAPEDYDLDFPRESKDVGTYAVNVILKSGYSGAGSADFEIVAKAIEPTVVLSPSTYAYDGEEKSPEVTVKDGEAALVAGQDYSVALPNDCRNAGAYTVEVTLRGNYSGSAGATFEIHPKETAPTITLSQTEYTYDGTEKAPRATVRDGAVTLVEGADYSISYPADRTNAGTYAVRVMLKGNYAGSGSTSFRIGKASQAISASNVSKVYGDPASALGARRTAGDGTLSYSSSDASVVSVDSAGMVTVRGAGTAKITVKAAATANYNAASRTVTVTVAKASQSISASNISKTYGARTFSLGAKLARGDGKLTYSSSNAKVASIGTDGKVAIKGAGTATVTVKAAATGNYNAASRTMTVTVAKAANPLKLAKATRSVKAKDVKKRNKVVAGAKVSKKGQGAVTYSIKSFDKKGKKYKKYVKINKKSGKITIKKGCPKCTIKVTVKAVAAGNANYNKSAAKTAVVTIRVK